VNNKPTKLGLSFQEWQGIVTRKVHDLGMVITCTDTVLHTVWAEGKSTGWVVTHYGLATASNIATQQGEHVLDWARTNNAQSIPATRLKDEPVARKSNGEKVIATVRMARFDGVPLEERLLDPHCPIDDRIKFAWETVRIKKGKLSFAEYYGDAEHYEDEMAGLGRQIEMLLEHRERLRHVHTYSQEIQDKLCEQLFAAEAEHKSLCAQRQAQKAAIELAKLVKAGKPLPQSKATKARVPLTRDQVLSKYNITNETIVQMKANGLDPEAMILRMMV